MTMEYNTIQIKAIINEYGRIKGFNQSQVDYLYLSTLEDMIDNPESARYYIDGLLDIVSESGV